MQLRPYQKESIDAVYEHLRAHDDNPCIVIPTAGGKTPVMATICRDAVGRWNGRVLILAHVKELLEQTVARVHDIAPEMWMKIGVYSAGLKSRDTEHPIIVAGIQSVYRRGCDLGPFDLIMVDEAHMIPADGDGMYRSLLADMRVINPLVRVIGLTATPFRMKSGMICAPENFLNSVCYEVGVKELIRDGYLCRLVTKSGRQKADTSGLHVRAGEVYGNTLTFERDRTLEDFRAGKLKYLVNMNVLTTGFDAPNIDCVALVRPTMSPGLYYQMVGRGFRLHPDKEDCLVLDFGGNVLRHGPVDQIKVQPVQNGNGEAPAKECPQCHSVIAAGYATCPDCGYEFPPPERQRHEAKASTAGILSGQETITEYPVQEVFHSVHTKRGAPPEHPKTMRVEYQINLRHYVSEWVCPEHSGYARAKFESWWRQRCDARPPGTAEDAVALAEEGALAPTSAIKVRSVVGEKFDQVVNYTLGEKPRLPGWDDELVERERVGAFADLRDEDMPF